MQNCSKLIEERDKPQSILSDNRTEFTSNAILQWGKEKQINWQYIQHRKPIKISNEFMCLNEEKKLTGIPMGIKVHQGQKICSLLSIVFIFFMVGCSMSDGLSEKSRMSYAFIKQFGERMHKRYGVDLGAIGGGDIDGLCWLMTVGFSRKGNPVNIEEARRMIVFFSEEFLKEINSKEEFKSYLMDYPFSENNLDFSIIYLDENGYNIHFPGIHSVGIDKGEIIYFIKEQGRKYGLTCLLQESYRDALEKIKQET